MKLLHTLKVSLLLLTKRDRWRLGLAAAMQMATSILDLLGVLALGVVTALAMGSVGEGAPPPLVVTVVDRVGLSGMEPLVLAAWLALVAGVLLLGKSLVNLYLTRRVLNFLANRQATVSGRLASALLSQPLIQIQQRSSQETVYALTTSVYFATLVILGNGVVALSELTLLIVLAIGLVPVSPLVTLFTIFYFAAIGFLLQKTVARWALRIGEGAAYAEVKSIATVQEALATYRETVVTNRRAWYAERFQDLRWQAARVQADTQFMSLLPKYVFEAALILGGGLLAVSQLLTRDLTAAVAIIAVFLVAGTRIVPSMLRLHGSGLSVLSSAGQADACVALADQLHINEAANVADYQAGERGLAFLGQPQPPHYSGFVPTVDAWELNFTYPDSDRPAIDDVSFEVPAGSSLALVGTTGSGKSTLVDLLLGVTVPDEGRVRIGGLPPLHAAARWPGGIAYVPQAVGLANASIRRNVALGIPDAAIDDELVWEALERSHLAAFLKEQRDGLDTVVGESGVRLSGGQRQRLGLARAMYAKPRLIVLDEATSALDSETEHAISSALMDLEDHVTRIFVAHRLATIRGANHVIYLHSGRITAEGTFDDVRRQSPQFDRQARLLGL